MPVEYAAEHRFFHERRSDARHQERQQPVQGVAVQYLAGDGMRRRHEPFRSELKGQNDRQQENYDNRQRSQIA